MFYFFDNPPETFIDEKTGTRLTLSSFRENGRIKEIAIDITDKDGHRSQVTLNSKYDIRRFLNHLDDGVPVRPMGSFATSSNSISTAPSYMKTGIGVFFFYKESDQTRFVSVHRLDSVLDRDYEGLCDCFEVRPDAIVLFFWYDGSIGREAIEAVISFCVNYQRDFVFTGDPMKCRRMTLGIVAEQTGVNISSVSRCADKEVRIFTPHTVFNLDNRKCSLEEPSLFDEGVMDVSKDGESKYVTRNGREISRLQLLATLKDLIEKEDKNHPYRDENLSALLTEMGYPVQRRTVAKYRELLGIASSSGRKTVNPT